MKQLLLIRHAKSSWDSPGKSDHDRPLNDRGERDAPKMAAALQQRGVIPDHLLSSTALRARSTAVIIAAGLGYSPSKIETESDLYLASPRTILSCVQKLDEKLGTVLIFGHNPGMHEASVKLTSDPGLAEFPTLAVARIEFEVEFWGEVDWNTGLLMELLTPKTLVDL